MTLTRGDSLNTRWTWIAGTAVVVSSVWAFFFYRMVELKDVQIEIAKQNAIPDATQRLEAAVRSRNNEWLLSGAALAAQRWVF